MNPSFSQQIEQLLAAVEVHSEDRYSWVGELFAVSRPGMAPLPALRTSLEARLYESFYGTGGIAPAADVSDPRPDEWGAELVSANQHDLGVSPVPAVYVGRDGGVHIVEWAGIQVRALDEELASPDANAGQAVSLLLPAENLGVPSGFFTRYGAAGVPTVDVDRYYWNVVPDGRAALVDKAAQALNSAYVPFRFKVLNDRRVFRCDAAVLYVATADRSRVQAHLIGVAEVMGPHFDPGTPVGALRLRDGVAFAEDPPGDLSFGTRLCGLLAEAVITGWQEGWPPDARLGRLLARLSAAGLDCDAPFRNPGSTGRLPCRSEWSR